MAVRIKPWIAASLLSAAVTIAAPTISAQEQTVHQFDLPAQPLAEALRAIARQTGENVLFVSKDLSGIEIKELQGQLTTAEAIQRLLEGTRLEAKQTTPTTVIVQPILASPQPSSNRVELEEIVVTGSHIRGAPVVGSTLISLDREAIDKSGYGRLQDLLETLPQNYTGVSEDFAQAGTSNLTYGAEIQLRGLGPGTTLTLLNGHRLPGGGTLGAFVDISSIPVSAIERAEILPDGASAIYGSDAIGGVVNIILRKDFEGAETRARFASIDGDANEMELAQLFGEAWSSGHLLVGYQYTQRDAFEYGDSPYLATGELTRFGGTDRRRDNPPRRGGYPGNILNARGEVAYAIPGNQDGRSLTAGQLLPGAINYQDVSYATMLPEQKMHSAFASLSQRFGERVELSLDALYSSRRTELLAPLGGLVVSVPSRNPFYVNPFGGTAPVRVEYDFSGELSPVTSRAKSDALSLSVGPKVDLGGDWTLPCPARTDASSASGGGPIAPTQPRSPLPSTAPIVQSR